MEIDLFTLAAQVVNFLILSWLLKRFLFDRVARVMDERAKRTGAALAEAETARAKAREEAAGARALREEVEASRDGILAEARARAAEGMRVALGEARASGEAERRAWRADLAARKRDFLEGLEKGAASWLGELARKALVDLADEDLEARMTAVFLGRFEGLDESAIGEMRSSLEKEGKNITIISSFSIDEPLRDRIIDSARRKLAWEGDIDFRIDLDEGVGVALLAGGFRVAWGVGEYVRDIEARLGLAFEEEGGKEAGNG